MSYQVTVTHDALWRRKVALKKRLGALTIVLLLLVSCTPLSGGNQAPLSTAVAIAVRETLTVELAVVTPIPVNATSRSPEISSVGTVVVTSIPMDAASSSSAPSSVETIPVLAVGQVTFATAESIVRFIENDELDSSLHVTVKDGIERLSKQKPNYKPSKWEVRYLKNYHIWLGTKPGPEEKDRPIYWATLWFETPNGERGAVFAAEPLKNTSYVSVFPCNELSDLLSSRIFGGPVGDNLQNPIWCRDRDGRWAGDIVP